jgi:hypothetical protein
MTLLQARTVKVVFSAVLFLSAVLLMVPCGFANVVPVNDPSFGPITVINPSFEENYVPGPLPCGHGPQNVGCSFTDGELGPGWTHSGVGVFGRFRPGTQLGNHHFFSSLPAGDGITSAYSTGGTISQTVGPVVQTGVEYIFTVDLGERHDTPFVSSADLLLSGPHPSQTIDAAGTDPSKGHWSTFTATFVGNSSNVGDHITIQLKDSGRGNQGNFDSVTLTAVPEPGTLLLFGSGMLLLVLIVSRKQLRTAQAA